MIAKFTDKSTGKECRREWKIKSATDSAVMRALKKEWVAIAYEISAYFGETFFQLTDGEFVLVDGTITSNVFAGRTETNFAYYKPNSKRL